MLRLLKVNVLLFPNETFFTFQPFQHPQPGPDVQDGSSPLDPNPGTYLRVQLWKVVNHRLRDDGQDDDHVGVVVRVRTVRVELSGTAEDFGSSLRDPGRFRQPSRRRERRRGDITVAAANSPTS